MARHERTTSKAQRLASLAVLAALCALTAWLLAVRTQLNPAVEVALRAPALKAGAVAAAGEAAPAAEASAATPNAVGRGPVTLASLLPEPPSGMKPLTAAESFTPATLSDRIDGKAELYLSAGFLGMACRSYAAGAARIEVSLYRMKSPDAAFAVFSGQRRPGSAQSPLAKNAYLTENALFLTSGADYLEVIADRAGAKASLETLAKAALTALGPGDSAGEKKSGAAEAQPGDLFPKAGIKADSLRLSVGDAFGVEGLSGVYTAEYDTGATAFITRRKNPAEAAALARTYQRFLTDNGYAVQDAPGAPAGAVVLAMEGSVEILFARGALLAGVHDAPKLDAALKLAAELDGALKASSKGPGREK